MASDVYIFGYQSILAAGSLATSIGKAGSDQPLVPVRLEGYVRCWSAVRSFATNETKRYIHTSDWRIAERVAFATLRRSSRVAVNGVCCRISGNSLAELDFREQGYVRVEVSGSIFPYDGYEVDTLLRCYTYIDPSPDPNIAVVSLPYYYMGRSGAASISNIVPEFLADYMSSTEQPELLADDLAFVFFSADGRHLWLLEEADSSLVLLHQFALPQFTPLTREPSEPVRKVTAGLEWLDARHRILGEVSHNKRIPLEMVKDLLRGANGEDISGSAYWLCRLAAVDYQKLTPAQLSALSNDSDFWVRRTAKFRSGAL